MRRRQDGRHTKKAPSAQVNKLNVALIVDKSVPANAAFEGYGRRWPPPPVSTLARGDTMTAPQMAFAKAVTPKAGPVPTTLLGPLGWVGLGLARASLPLLHDRRAEKAREREPRTPAWLTATREPVSLAQLQARARPNYARHRRLGVMLPPRSRTRSLHQLDQLMERRARARCRAGQGLDGGGLG